MDATQRNSKQRTARRKYLINPSFQWKFVGWILANVFAVSAFTGVLLLNVQERYLRSRMLNPETTDVGDVATIVIGFALLFSAISGGAFAIWSIVLTHRVCGPLHVLALAFDEWKAGRFPQRRHQRKKDEFKEIHARFWDALDAQKARRRAEYDLFGELQQIVRSASRGDDDERRHALEIVGTRLDALRKKAAKALGEPFEPGQSDDAQPVDPSGPARVTRFERDEVEAPQPEEVSLN